MFETFFSKLLDKLKLFSQYCVIKLYTNNANIMKMQTQQTSQKEINNNLKLRVSQVVAWFREQHPEISVDKFFVKEYPQYDNMRGLAVYKNAKWLRTANEDVTIKLEALKDKLKNY